MATLESINRWLKQHSASERSFGRALRRFFADQANALADIISDEGSHVPLPLVFNPHEWHEKLLPLVRRNVGVLMVTGAIAELDALERRSEAQKQLDLFDSDVMERFDLGPGDVATLFFESIPEGVRQRIFAAVDETTRQDYWLRIQDGVRTDLGQLVKESIAEGESPQQLARRIREQLGGEHARRRSKVIARTETGNGLNAGHQAALEDIADAGELVGKQWLTIGDTDVRESHVDLNGVVVPVKDSFSVGGYLAPWPSHWSLPAAERANCRCTTVGAFSTN